jgi:hypothetical protein
MRGGGAVQDSWRERVVGSILVGLMAIVTVFF